METQSFLDRKGLALVISSPSGAGKTTIARKLLETDSDMKLSVSATTRLPRPGEIHEQDYYFLSQTEFKKMVADGDMLEHANVFGSFYGSPKGPVIQWQDKGKDILFDIDWQGTRQLKQTMPNDIVSIFILPPSADILYERLDMRAKAERDKQKLSHSTATNVTPVNDRMQKAKGEIQHWSEYDYVLVNDVLEDTIKKVQDILAVERYKRTRLPSMCAFVRKLEHEITCLFTH